jgi:hypothetical protein
MTGKRGMALFVIIFFALAVGAILFALLRSNVNLLYQNKNTLRSLQAYYLVQSGAQHTLLKLRLLPRECYKALAANSATAYNDVDSTKYSALVMNPPANGKYDLFKSDPPAEASPYHGHYRLEELTLKSANKGMRFAVDSFAFRVTSEILPLYPHNTQLQVTDTIEEEVIVSRFTGGLGTP